MRLHAGLSATADPMGPTADGLTYATADGFEFPDGPDDEPDEDEG